MPKTHKNVIKIMGIFMAGTLNINCSKFLIGLALEHKARIYPSKILICVSIIYLLF
jgi:hypothetical protein